MQNTNQVPALFKRNTKRQKTEKNVNLTQAQVQQLICILKENISIEHSMLKDTKRQASIYWNYCNPDDPSTKEYFHTLNYFKDVSEQFKQKIAKLNKLQNTLKKMR